MRFSVVVFVCVFCLFFCGFCVFVLFLDVVVLLFFCFVFVLLFFVCVRECLCKENLELHVFSSYPCLAIKCM